MNDAGESCAIPAISPQRPNLCRRQTERVIPKGAIGKNSLWDAKGKTTLYDVVHLLFEPKILRHPGWGGDDGTFNVGDAYSCIFSTAPSAAELASRE